MPTNCTKEIKYKSWVKIKHLKNIFTFNFYISSKCIIYIKLILAQSNIINIRHIYMSYNNKVIWIESNQMTNFHYCLTNVRLNIDLFSISVLLITRKHGAVGQNSRCMLGLIARYFRQTARDPGKKKNLFLQSTLEWTGVQVLTNRFRNTSQLLKMKNDTDLRSDIIYVLLSDSKNHPYNRSPQ